MKRVIFTPNEAVAIDSGAMEANTIFKHALSGTANSFSGTWKKDENDVLVTVVITNTAWTSEVADIIYNSGTYTYNGGDAQCEITIKGRGSAKVGEKGNAKIVNDKMIVSNFSDNWMNGTYSKYN